MLCLALFTSCKNVLLNLFLISTSLTKECSIVRVPIHQSFDHCKIGFFFCKNFVRNLLLFSLFLTKTQCQLGSALWGKTKTSYILMAHTLEHTDALTYFVHFGTLS